MVPSPKTILGGGLSGLSAAYYLSKLAGKEKLALIEASNHLGGWIKSEKVDKEVVFEQGPRTIRPVGAAGINTLNLLDDLGLNSEVVPITRDNVAAKNRLIYVNGELHTLPNSILSLLSKQKPFSKPLALHLMQDLTAKSIKVPDESLYDFTKRRFGPEIADYLIDAMLCGICAGNSREVSVNFLMKKLFMYEQKYGSITKGVFKHLLDKKEKLPNRGLLAAQAKLGKWNVYTFKGGMETLPIALEGALKYFGNTQIHLNMKCEKITFNNDKCLLDLHDGSQQDSSHIISSIAAKNLAYLIANQHPDLANKLAKIKMVDVAVINLFYNGNLIKNPGFGFLVPPKEKLPILGVIYDSCCHNYQNKTVLTVMMGGYWFKDLFGDDPSEETLFNIARDNLNKILNISDEPVQYKVNILRQCIPQYLVGHQQNLEEINKYIKDKKLPLSLCGASYNGVGVNDVILSAKNAVENIYL
ncbi:unnamed protein product [Ceutorhynchus assimilis]|uniref:Protoporphyrinogen oxidase n=1 Tax=Ceutorhynchus assimilis TaxID=467358 RepID=A0A9N9N2Q1_9CUCU|nr:unnamed protein product [Ceutorhynchus assimilis]